MAQIWKFSGAYRAAQRVPLIGRGAFSLGYRLAAPYFLTIPARIETAEPGRAQGRMSQLPWVRNHLGTIHAIALCNLAEFTMGAAAEMTIPPTHRWVPKGMTVEYLAKARGTVHATATLRLPEPLGDRLELPVEVTVRDQTDAEVFTATIRIWVTEKR